MLKKLRFLVFILAGLLTLFITACGYPTPPGGGGLTPFVIVVTPTIAPERLTASAQLTQQAMPSPTPQPTPTPPPTSRPTTAAAVVPTPISTLSVAGDTYVVQPGDTLTGISVRLKVDLDELIALNKIEDPNSLQVGQKLKIPPRATPTPNR
jgi:LysM repeat protein